MTLPALSAFSHKANPLDSVTCLLLTTMAATPSDMATPVPDDSNRARSPDVPDLSTVDAKLSHLATNIESTTSDHMDTLRTMIATLSSLIDFYDPSGVLIKRHSDPPADHAPGHEPSRRSEPLFSHSETPRPPSRSGIRWPLWIRFVLTFLLAQTIRWSTIVRTWNCRTATSFH